MADTTLEWLKNRFRVDVDDIDHDPADQSGLLWSDDDVLEYIDEAHSQFVHDTLYRHELLRIYLPADLSPVNLKERVIELRGEVGYLESSGTPVHEVNANETGVSAGDDYGTDIDVSPFKDQTPGRPRSFSLDIDEGKLHLFPPSSVEDVLEIPAYLEANEIDDWNLTLDISNKRHIRMLLDGMKALAYAKQDADVFDPNQAARWQVAFERNIAKVAGERKRRRRGPGVVQYGGI